jgi:perosamine synthetase
MIDEIPLSRPDITEEEVRAVTEVLRSGRLSIGPAQETFENLITSVTDTRHAVACSSGTAGLHMALLAMGVGPGDEVITTPFSFIASSNAIVYTGAKPVFVEIDSRTLNIDTSRIEDAITEKTKAILGVEVFGNPAGMEEIRAIADKHEIKFLEDACEGLGGAHKGKKIGSFGHAAVFGFYPNKQITTGEGGVVVTDDSKLAERCMSLRNHGRSPMAKASTTGMVLNHETLGYNYRMAEINAALGVAQIKRLDDILEHRNRAAEFYLEQLIGNPDVILPTISPETTMSWFVFVTRLSDQYTAEERDRVIAGMHRHDVGAASYFPCIHLQPYYRKSFGCKEGDHPIAESVSQRTIALPFHTRLSRSDATFAAQTFELMLSRENIRRT